MTKKASKRYSQDFQKSSAYLAITSDQAISKTAKELGVDPQTIRSWINKHFPDHLKNKAEELSPSDMQAELKQLRKDLARVTLERDILKKATAYFASDQL